MEGTDRNFSMFSTRISPIIIRGLMFFLWLGIIFLFSSLSGSPYPYDPPLWYYLERKSAHVIEFAILMMLAVRFAFALFPRETFGRILLLASFASVAFGALDELHQSFVPYRGARLSDVLVDCIGVAVVTVVYFLIYQRNKKNKA